MKRIMILVILVALIGCKKEEECNCGTIANDGIDSQTNCYWLEIRNDCTSRKKKFCFDEDVWMTAYVGSNFCVDDVGSW